MTAQDVRSSLYYIHADSDDDERLRRDAEIRGQSESTNTAPPAGADRPIQRRPVPEGLKVAMDSQPDTPPIAPVHRQRPYQDLPHMEQMARKPVNLSAQPALENVPSKIQSSETHVMGPRAMRPRLHSDFHPGDGTFSGQEDHIYRRWSEQPPIRKPPLPSRPQHLALDSTSNQPTLKNAPIYSPFGQEPASLGPFSNLRRSTSLQDRGRSLTLIRRYNGSQWNIGTVSSIGGEESPWNKPPGGRQDDLSICISTPGYSKFCDFGLSQTPGALPQTFERQLTNFRRRSRDKSSEDNHLGPKSNRKLRKSVDFRKLNTPRLDNNDELTDANLLPDQGSSGMKGYGFYSPWNGICQFSSGISGHAVKCKHTASTEGAQAVTVSELRFNLPPSNNLPATSPRLRGSPEKSRSPKRSSYFSSANGSVSRVTGVNSQTPPEPGDIHDHFDLSLGQEHAGGGFGGKQAKLGKLIIEPEGLKMLDLLIAANMALWWKVYEKSA